VTAVEPEAAPVDDDMREAPAARAALYAVLARAFEHPDEEFHSAVDDGSLQTELEAYVDRSGLGIAVPALPAESDYESLAAQYNGLFEIGYAEYTDRTDGSLDTEGPPVPLYESRYRDAAWEDVNGDLARAYDYFGVSVDQDQRDHHDNIRLELEFAAYLARREALGEGDAGRARRDLLDRHLVPFMEGLLDRITDVDDGFYTGLARLARRVVRADRASLRDALDEPDGGPSHG
jgi:DMSO reductase family type II enzyme chaperone